MDEYQHLKCPGHYVSLSFLKRFQDRGRTTRPSNLFRQAIGHQSFVLRRWLREELKTDQFSLDHHPVPFSALKHIFLKQQGINPEQLTYQAITVKMLKDWQLFHGALAEYRVITPTLNALLGQCHMVDLKGDNKRQKFKS